MMHLLGRRSAPNMGFPSSHRDAVAQYHRDYDQGIANGTFLPFIYPIASIGAALGLLFFLIPPSSPFHNRFTRYLTFALIACCHAYIILNCKGLNPSTGFGVGGITTFGTIWAAVLLVFNDPKVDFKRIHRRPRGISAKGDETGKPALNALINGSIHLIEQDHNDKGYAGSQFDYYWQHYPEFLADRFWWVLDLWINFRLIGWDHGLTTMPTVPAFVQSQLNQSIKRDDKVVDRPITTTGLRRFESHDKMIQHYLWVFIKGYLMLDFLFTITHHDAFFRGIVDASPPSGLPQFMLYWPGLWVTGYRLFAGMAFVWLGLRNMLVLSGLLMPNILDGKVLGTWQEPWLYPDHYGSFTVVLDQGLAGWWGGWWHQSFRASFLAASDWLISGFNITPHTIPARIVSVLTSFFLSGLIHAAGSASLVGASQPWKAMLFFMLQPIGIFAEVWWHQMLSKYGVRRQIPAWIGRLANLAWVLLWFWYTAPMFVNDIAKGGLWMAEMVPLSPARALGLGEKGDGIFCWDGAWTVWHQGQRWWTSGLAL